MKLPRTTIGLFLVGTIACTESSPTRKGVGSRGSEPDVLVAGDVSDALDFPPDSGFSLEFYDFWGRNGIGGEGAWGRGSGPGEFAYPLGIALSPDEQEAFVSDVENGRIVVMSRDGVFLRSWPLPPRVGSCDAYSGEVTGVGRDGTVYTVDHTVHGIVGYTPSGVVRYHWPLVNVPAFCDAPHMHFLAFDAKGHIYVSEILLNQIQEYTADGTYIRSFGEHGVKGFLHGPCDVSWMDGRIYVNDSERVVVYTEDGLFERAIPLANEEPGAVHLSTLSSWNGWLFASSDDPPTFFAMAPGAEGFEYTWATRKGSDVDEFLAISAVAIDGGGRWYVTDMYNHRVEVMTAHLPMQ